MTRENKLALVVGFGLILFVGILISDHFSVVRTQVPANMTTVIDPLAFHQPANDPGLIDLMPAAPTADHTPDPMTVPGARSTMVLRTTTVHDDQPNSIVATTPPAVNPTSDFQARVERESPIAQDTQDIPEGFVRVQEPMVAMTNVTAHQVRRGESLYAICRHHYGDTSLVKTVANLNGLADPNQLEVGTTLRLPNVDSAAPRTASAPSNSPAVPETYTVKQGDSLERIAKRFYGSSTKWRSIYNRNRNLIRNPNQLEVGMVLNLS